MHNDMKQSFRVQGLDLSDISNDYQRDKAKKSCVSGGGRGGVEQEGGGGGAS